MAYSWLASRLTLTSTYLVRRYSAAAAVVQGKYGAVIRRETNNTPPSKPLVVILGWNDGKVKHLEKFSALFEKRDWPTICLPTTSINTFLRSGTKTKTISYYMIDLIKELTQQANRKVLFYAFSNGGSAVYFHISEALIAQGQPYFDAFEIAGSIFDSGPTKPNMESILRAQKSVAIAIKNPILRTIVWHMFGLLLPMIVENNPLLARFFDDLGNLPLKHPQLFLYSKADQLTLVEHVDEHIRHRKAIGVQVFSKCWENSSHVAHYKTYPEEYQQQIESFLKVCKLTENDN